MVDTMVDFKQFFKGKKITLMRIGLLGRGVGDAAFLAECGAEVLVVDDAPKKVMQLSVDKLKKYKNIKFKFGKYDLKDFRNCDFVLKGAGTPIDSPEITHAKKHNIPIEMDVSLFAKLAPDVTVIGVTGTRGKSMTTALIYEILSQDIKNKKVFLGGNVRGIATLPFLKKAKAGDILVCELDSWQLQGFGDSKISPNIAVFTSFMPDHMNYYRNSMKKYFGDKANIFKYQKKEDVLIIRPNVKKLIQKELKNLPAGRQGRLIVIKAEDADEYTSTLPGKFQKENLACAVAVALEFDISVSQIKKAVRNFKGLEGRLQYLKTVKRVKIYNDNNATTPEATMAGIEALSLNFKDKKIILICGGADKNLPLDDFIKVLNKYCKIVITIPGKGTDRLLGKKLKTENYQAKNLKEAVAKGEEYAEKGDIILFSPAFSSFSQYKNEYERGDEFIKITKNLK
ncbi:MAG TPA: UDP-N-acetylmuramoyl-L-alanine--D-glutamate ligase [Candidatus Paceibacterota bacterium]|jgi:UDP-N-acetylmuramoylalanine--D-glutamate ligase|nr:UDP-N-acetylmuramoyl-L-alanine--D-glutamate ligase [Candidatus Paceibacterota bacterium]